MSDVLTRGQVENTIRLLQNGSPRPHQGHYLLAHDAALRAEIERLKGEVIATHDVTERRVQYAQQKMMEAQARIAYVEEEYARLTGKEAQP